MSTDRLRLRDGLQALMPFATRLSGAGGWLALGLLLGVITLASSLGLLGLSGAYLTGAAIAGLTPATSMSFNFFYPGAGVRGFAISRTAARYGERVITHEGIFRWLAGLRVWLYGRLARLSPRQLAAYHGGELLNRLVQDIDALDNLHPRVLLPMAAAVLVFAAAGLLFAWVVPALLWLPGLLILVAVLLLPLAGWRLGQTLLPRLIRERATLRTRLLDSCEGLEDLSLHAPAWAQQRERSLRTADAWLDTQLRSARRGALLRALVSAGVGLAAWACLGLLVAAPVGLRPDAPWISALVLLLLGSAEVLLPLAGACLDLPGTATAAARVNALSEAPPAQTFASSGPVPADAGLRIEGLRFAWDAHTPVFDGLDLQIAPGEHLLLTGESGCGKSSLLQLLTRFEDPQGGRILLGGVDLMALDEPTLRRQVACATQHSWAKTATLADNLRLARPEASDDALRQVLDIVGLLPEQQGWRDGLATWVEEGGASLSGGQRRRLAVARALLREAPVTLLDEPSEGLDDPAQDRLVQRVTQHLKGRTLVWVSHRDHTQAPFHRVLRLPSAEGGTRP